MTGKRGTIFIDVDPELRDLVPRYLDHRGGDVDTMTAALGSGDFDLIGRIAHNLQGSGCSFGLDGLSAIGADIERAGRAGDRGEIARQLTRLEDYLSRVEIGIEGDAVAGEHSLAVPAGTPAAGYAQVEVLLADDQEMNLAIVGRFLRREGYKVRSVTSGEAVLAVLAALPSPALILLDVMMSGADGLEICRRIKSNPTTRDIPVVLVTSGWNGRGRRRARAVGADGFLSKPVRREELVARVGSLLRTGARAGSGTELYAEPR